MEKTCFVVCPISSENSETRKRSDQVLKHFINPICQSLGYNVTRVDHIKNNDKIDQTVIENLKTSDLVIADITEHNPNAFFELGYRSALGKPLIQIALENTNIPFDIANVRTIFYVVDDLDKAESTKERLRETIINVEQRQQQITELAEDSKDGENDSSILHNMVDLLYEIKDSTDGLYELVRSSNTELIDTMMNNYFKALREVQPADPQSELIKIMVSTIFQEPDKFGQLMKLSKEIENTT